MKGEVLSVKVTFPKVCVSTNRPLLREKGFRKAETIHQSGEDPKFVKSLGVDGQTLEGYLFPDTY